MSNNLNLDQMTTGQANKEATVNTITGQVDAAITETIDIDVTSGNVTLSNEQYRRGIRYKVTGATTAGRTVTVPAIKRWTLWIADSTNTQSFDIVCGSTTKPMASDTAAMVYTDGTTNGLEAFSLIDASGITPSTIAGLQEYIEDTVGAQITAGTGISVSYNDATGALTITNSSPFSNESVDDRVAALLVAGTNITLTYNDGAGTLTIDATAGSNLTVKEEGVNLDTAVTSIDFVGALVTASNTGHAVTVTVTNPTAAQVTGFDEAVDDRVAALLVAGTNITLTYNDAAGTLTIDSSGGGGSSITAKDEGSTLTSAMTSINFVGAGVTATNSSGDVTVTISGGGGSSGMTPMQWTAKDNQPPASNMATLDTRNNHLVLDFDTTTQEAAIFAGVLPHNYAGAGVTIYLYCALTSATTGTVGWDVAFERIDASSLDIDADSFGSATTVTATTVPGTSGQILKMSVNVSDGANMDSLAAGEAFRLRIRRDVANDTATGDAELLRVYMKEQ